MKRYIICTLLGFCASLKTQENQKFTIQFDIDTDTCDIYEQRAFAELKKELADANSDPEYAATWQTMQEDLGSRLNHQSELIDENNKLVIKLQKYIAEPENMSNANKQLVAKYKKDDARHVALIFFSIPATITGIAIGIIKKPTFVTQNESAKTVWLREFINKTPLNKEITYTCPKLNIKASLYAADAIIGTVNAINHYQSSQSKNPVLHAQQASADVIGALIKHSLEPIETKTIIGNNKILILSNRNILLTLTNTAEQTIKRLPNQSLPSFSTFVRDLAIHTGLEINYNITAQILRKVAKCIGLPEGTIDACIPEDYVPKDCMQHMVKLGLNCGTYIAVNSALMKLSARCNPGA